jgi:uncharacterized secreted protein with C-terminal beta-propeller domain
MRNYQKNGLLLLASSLLFTISAQPIFAATTTSTTTKAVVSKLKPQKLTSRLTLANLLMKHQTNRFNRSPIYDAIFPTMAAPVAGATDSKVSSVAVAVAAPNTTPTTSVSHSDTNIQVAGVDESDIVKVGDDGYIYQIHGGKIRIVKAFPVVELTQTSDIEYPTDNNFTPSGIYIENNMLVVLGSSWQTLAQPAITAKMAYNYWCRRYKAICFNCL